MKGVAVVQHGSETQSPSTSATAFLRREYDLPDPASDGQRRPLRGRRRPPSAHDCLLTIDLRSRLDSLLTATRIECHLRLRAPVVQPSFVRLATRLAPSQAPLHGAPQYSTNLSAAFVCPFRVSARSSLPTRTGHTKAAPSHRAGNRRGKLRASSAVCFLRSDGIPGSSYRRNRKCHPHSPTAISPCASPY
jgi:hypothetical protein